MPNYVLPSLETDMGAMQAVLLAEILAPQSPQGLKTYTEEKVQISMLAMVATVQNRLTSSSYFKPTRIFGVTDPTTKRDIIGASRPTQFEGFSGLMLGNNQKANIQAKLVRANAETAEQATKVNSYSRFVDFAVSYSNAGSVKDPLKDFGGVYAWRTARAGGPGGDYYTKIPEPQGTILGNSFYTINGYDLVFVIDSTGSMGDDIATVNKVSTSLIDKISKPFRLDREKGLPTPNSRFAVVTYKDPGEIKTNLQFTESVMLKPSAKDDTKNAIKGIVAAGGDDYPEGVNSGLLQALNLPWRANPMRRRIILIGDAPAKDSNLANEVKAKATKAQIEIDESNLKPDPPAPNPRGRALNINAVNENKVTLSADPVRIFSVFTGSDSFAQAQFQDLADSTGGKSFSASSSSNLEAALLSAFDAISREVVGTNENDTLIGTAEAEDIIGLAGRDTLTGAGGADTFIVGSLRDAGDVLLDFKVGEDKFSIGQLLSSIGYFGSDPFADRYLGLRSVSNTGTLLQLDADGPLGSDIFRPVAFFAGVSELALKNSSNFIF